MKKMDLYLIRTISNLHVGSGEGDFSVIDKQVQRDPVHRLPVIHASGIKGALREAMQFNNYQASVEEIFGADPKTKGGRAKQGLNNFFDGKLLALPIRSSHNFYYIATCPHLLKSFISDLKLFKHNYPEVLVDELNILANKFIASGEPIYFGKIHKRLKLEEWEAKNGQQLAPEITELLGDRVALLHDDDFKVLADELPIIARNYLENGISRNLWYEEVVPREARFYTMISRNEKNDELNQYLLSTDNLVQIGANATVGYGLCEFKLLEQ